MQMSHGASRTACLRYLAICLFGASPVLSSKLEKKDPKSKFQQMVPDYNILDLNMGFLDLLRDAFWGIEAFMAEYPQG